MRQVMHAATCAPWVTPPEPPGSDPEALPTNAVEEVRSVVVTVVRLYADVIRGSMLVTQVARTDVARALRSGWVKALTPALKCRMFATVRPLNVPATPTRTWPGATGRAGTIARPDIW
jgi:hypothetical protein